MTGAAATAGARARRLVEHFRGRAGLLAASAAHGAVPGEVPTPRAPG